MIETLKNPYRKVYIHINSYCNHKCCSCILSNDFKKEELLIKPEILLKALEFLKFDKNTIIEISGGEPTLHPFFIEILKTIRKYHNNTISLLTNGSSLKKSKSLRDEIYNNIDDIVITVYSPYKFKEYEITKDPLSLKSKLFILRDATQNGLNTHLKTLVSKINFKDLGLLIELIKDSNISHFNINAIHLINNAWNNKEDLAVKYSEAAPFVEAAVDKLEEIRLSCSLVYPMCLIDPYYWKYFPVGFGDVIRRTLSIDVYGKINIAENLQREFFSKPEKCSSCSLKERCFWPNEGYIKYFGDNELKPIHIYQ